MDSVVPVQQALMAAEGPHQRRQSRLFRVGSSWTLLGLSKGARGLEIIWGGGGGEDGAPCADVGSGGGALAGAVDICRRDTRQKTPGRMDR